MAPADTVYEVIGELLAHRGQCVCSTDGKGVVFCVTGDRPDIFTRPEAWKLMVTYISLPRWNLYIKKDTILRSAFAHSLLSFRGCLARMPATENTCRNVVHVALRIPSEEQTKNTEDALKEF